jgi:uncharacterized membrane protein YbhN (UPF0104 family)
VKDEQDEDSRRDAPDRSTSGGDGRDRATAIRIAKWIIAIAVAVGLSFAARSALQQWREQRAELVAEIEMLDDKIAHTRDGSDRQLLVQQRQRLQSSIPELGNLRWHLIGLASILYGVALIPPGFLLHRALGVLGQHPRIGTSVAAQLIGHMGKYVPGKAMVVVLRTGALRKDGVRVVAATVCVFMETFLMMAVGGVVAGLVICWLPVPTWLTVTALAVAIVASLPTLPPFLTVAAKRFTQSDQALPRHAARRLFVAGWLYSLASWLLIGASFTAVIFAIPTAMPMPSLPYAYAVGTAAISLAMVVGFASLLPGGAGVRELVLTTVLGVSLGAAHGLLAAIAVRLIFIVVESAMGLASWLWLRRE